MKCVPKTSCDFDAVITEDFIQDTPELNALRVPLIPCINRERSNMVDVCCRDPNFKDPWPQMTNQNIDYDEDYGQGGSGSSQDYGQGGSGSSQDYGQGGFGNSQDYQDYQGSSPDIDIRNQHNKKKNKKKGNAYG